MTIRGCQVTNKKLDEVSSDSLMKRVKELDVQDIQLQIASERVCLFSDKTSHLTRFKVDGGFYVTQLETQRKFVLPEHVIIGSKVSNNCMSEDAVDFSHIKHAEFQCQSMQQSHINLIGAQAKGIKSLIFHIAWKDELLGALQNFTDKKLDLMRIKINSHQGLRFTQLLDQNLTLFTKQVEVETNAEYDLEFSSPSSEKAQKQKNENYEMTSIEFRYKFLQVRLRDLRNSHTIMITTAFRDC
mmetsp:Transcript_844/g.1134  ORF Transcript_844/g.1134 Transcript_844/m.1134 type:complete len:242 (+) Transcript_844:560-1285(+)|eukprot:CAMPEP_0185567128 /NCGR_PEP_ID=MMETSP0434-20130131/497_1 /TAXON_ID=626734 ORGANISM="Favella taraikaensis, Strain Fe Narragansett Bay" /NCGR_SAMPLE_ID=MMETSP0434 /ASSEMBLY_ACC=CAM_ASM_000379 /LENGTH=241 /DNA_ID=CAMNT_0028181281 /DNA_START=549 /DNA_END=1274 /DNA_ORIENTATION=-